MLNFEILRDNCIEDWYKYTHHEFVETLRLGTLPKANFQHYLCQDYVFLMEYSKAWAYAIYKAKSIEEMEFAYKGVQGLLSGEIDLHLSYCDDWNISKQQVFDTVAHPNNTAYTSYVLHCGENGSYMDMMSALAPCAIGYAEIGARIVADTSSNQTDNPYQSWMNVYGGDDFIQGAIDFKAFLEKIYTGISDSEVVRQKEIFKKATQLEIGFWDMGIEKQ